MSNPQPALIFSKYTIDELAHRLGVTKRYLCDLEDGIRPINPRFRFRACLLLGRPEAELFGASDTGEEN